MEAKMHKAPQREWNVWSLAIYGKILSKTLRKSIKYAEDGGESTSLKYCSVRLTDEQTELRNLKGQVTVEQGTELTQVHQIEALQEKNRVTSLWGTVT